MADRGTQTGETPSCCASGRPVSHSWLELSAARRRPKPPRSAQPTWLTWGGPANPAERDGQ
eukprot:8562395-Alexandrium_andersonii.AAC.1